MATQIRVFALEGLHEELKYTRNDHRQYTGLQGAMILGAESRVCLRVVVLVNHAKTRNTTSPDMWVREMGPR